MSFVMFFAGLSGIVCSACELLVYAIFKQGKRPVVWCLLGSFALTVVGFMWSLSVDIENLSVVWMLLSLVSPVVVFAIAVYFAVMAYKRRPLSEEKRAELQRNGQRREKEKAAKKTARQEERSRIAHQKAEAKVKKEKRSAAEKERQKAKRDWRREQAARARTISRVAIIGSASKANTGSAVGRAIVGDFVAGGVGSIVGASTAKKDGMTKFLVEFEDGHKAVETVKDNSPRFRELIKYVQM